VSAEASSRSTFQSLPGTSNGTVGMVERGEKSPTLRTMDNLHHSTVYLSKPSLFERRNYAKLQPKQISSEVSGTKAL